MSWQTWPKGGRRSMVAWASLVLTLIWLAGYLPLLRPLGLPSQLGDLAWRLLVVLLLLRPGGGQTGRDDDERHTEPGVAAKSASITTTEPGKDTSEKVTEGAAMNDAEDPATDKDVAGTAIGTNAIAPSTPAVDGGSPRQADAYQGAYLATRARLQEIDRRWREEKLAPAAAAAVAGGRHEALAVADLAAELATAMGAAGEPDPVVRNTRQIGDRLRAAVASGAAPHRPPSERLEPLPQFAQWCANGGREPMDYLRYLVQQEEMAASLLTADRGGGTGPEIDWREPAEALLLLAVARLPTADAPDPSGFRRLHERFKEALGYDEIEVAIGDPVDRDVHQVESMRGSRDQRPNRVLEILRPGYRARATGKVWRKALVVLSEQVVD